MNQSFGHFVAERAVDRVLDAAAKRLLGERKAPVVIDPTRWLFNLARIVARQEASREPNHKPLNPALVAAPVTREPDEATASAIQAALGRLTQRQRDAVRFCVMLDRSLSAAAQEMGCRPTTVLHHRNRALERLRGLLAEYAR